MIIEEVKKELTGHIIPFWNKLRDDENGGFYGFMSYDLKLDKQADKGVILHARILWFYSKAYITLGHFLTTHATLTSLSKTTVSTMSTAEFIG